MALWVQNEKKQKKIEDYFSSINSMTMRIMEERNRVISHYKGSWDKLSCNEQDKKMDEWFSSPSLKKKYSDEKDSESDPAVNVFPTLKMNTGQKIQLLDSDVHASWIDEHSDPFCCETKSQMNLRLPGLDSSIDIKKKSPFSSLDRTSSRTCPQEELHEQIFSSSSEVDYKTTEPEIALHEKSPICDQPASLGGGVTKLPASEITSFNIDDLTVTRCDLDEGYTKPVSIMAAGSSIEERRGEAFGRHNVISDIEKPGALPSQSKNGRKDDISYFKESQSSKIRKSENSGKTHSKESPTLPVTPTSSRKRFEKQSIACRKVARENAPKSSGYSKNPVNPRSSLTLDGAIYNLEAAMRQSSQTSNSDKGGVKAGGSEDFSFDDFGKLDGGSESDYRFGSAPGEKGSPVLDQKDVEILTGGFASSSSTHKTGFDFLDNW